MPINCEGCPRQTAKAKLGREIAWAGGWQEYHQKRKEWEMYDLWTERYNKLRQEYAATGEE